MWNGGVFQISGPRYIILLAPNVTWFMMGTSRLGLHWFRIAPLVFLSSKMSFIKFGFILFSVLNISIQRLRSLVTFIILLPARFRIDSYEDHNYHIETEKLFFARTQSQTLFVVLLWVGGWGVGIEFLLRKIMEK